MVENYRKRIKVTKNNTILYNIYTLCTKNENGHKLNMAWEIEIFIIDIMICIGKGQTEKNIC